MNRTAILILSIFVLAHLVSAQTNEFTYQGRLAAGGTAANTAHDFEFRLCSSASEDCTTSPPDGGMLGTFTRPGVTVTNGIFTVKLDFNAAHFNGADRWLEIAVRPAGGSTFTLLTPRQRVTSAPYSIKSLNSETANTATNATQLGGAPASQFVQTNDSRLSDDRNPLPNSSNYIRNSSSPQPNSHFNISGSGTIGGALRIEGSGFILPNTPTLSLSSTGIFQIDAPFLPSGRFVVLENGNVGIGNGAPTQKLQVAGNVLVSGTLTATQYNIGSNRALGVAGTNNLFAGINAGAANIGNDNTFVGANAGLSNIGSIANSFFGSGAGQSSTGAFNSFLGVGAGANNTAGNHNTIIGAQANVGTNNLDHATAIGAGAVVNTSNTVVLGRGADLVRVPGHLTVTGTISKGGGAFKIDHPLDPQNKYLSHSFVESPDMMNVYNDNVVTDERGDAIVKLPDYFEALNRDFRYQLTVIGQFAQAIIGEEIKNNQFKIKTNKPGVKVSWQVTGIRQDKFAQDNRIPNEENKSSQDRGKCLYAPLCNGVSIDEPARKP